jgi:hypothetical protein
VWAGAARSNTSYLSQVLRSYKITCNKKNKGKIMSGEFRKELIKKNERAAAPVVSELIQTGFQIEGISDLFNKRYNYRYAIPILMKWLPRVENIYIKEEIVRALSVKWAKPDAGPLLVDEFRKADDATSGALKWAIANALSVVADESVMDDILELVQDRRHGSARQMLAIALGNIGDKRAEDMLIDMLDDEEVAGHAIMGLGKLKSKKARLKIEPFLLHTKTWVRREAKKALARNR